MKAILIFLISIQVFGTKIKFEYNERVNLIRFMFTISDYGEGSILLKSIYKAVNGDKDKNKIREFKELIDSIPRNIDLYPWNNKIPQEYVRWKKRSELLIFFASASKNLNDFKSSLYSVYPTKKAYKLTKLINYFLPVYRKTYYNKQSKTEVKKLLKYLKHVNRKTQSFFELEKTFYDAKINIPEIKIFIYPLFMSKKVKKYLKENNNHITTRSRSFKTIQIVEITLPFKNNKSWYGVVLHEIAHFCYDSSETIPIFTTQMKTYYDKYGYYAAKYLNEALATAIGNGYVSEKMNKPVHVSKRKTKKVTKNTIIHKIGSANESETPLNDTFGNQKDILKEWYNNPIIDGYAHAIYPVVKQILENKGTLNISQSRKFAEIFKKTFPDILTRKEIIFNSVNVITNENFNYRELINGLRKYVNVNNSSASSPLNHKISIDFYNKDKKIQIFVLKANEINELKVYKDIQIESLKKDLKSEKSFVKITFNKNKDRFELFFIIANINEYSKLVKKIMKLNKITENIIYMEN